MSSLVRTGWGLRGVPASVAETVASHMFSSSLLVLELHDILRGKVGFNPYRAAAIALVHDLAEAFIGDIANLRGGFEGVKQELEARIAEERVEPHLIRELLLEYIGQRTTESKVARLANYLATYIQALRYERMGYDVSEIRESASKAISGIAVELGIGDDVVKRILKGIDAHNP